MGNFAKWLRRSSSEVKGYSRKKTPSNKSKKASTKCSRTVQGDQKSKTLFPINGDEITIGVGNRNEAKQVSRRPRILSKAVRIKPRHPKVKSHADMQQMNKREDTASTPSIVQPSTSHKAVRRVFSSPSPRLFRNSSMEFKATTSNEFMTTGSFLNGFRYEIDSTKQAPVLVGKGSCGRVYVGSLSLQNGDKTVCIKNIINNDDLLHEYQLLLKLRNTGCVPWTYGLFRTHKDVGNIVDGIVMDYVYPGRTIESALTQGVSLSELTWARVVLKAANALQVVHDYGVLINDVKTDNLIITEKPPSTIEVVIIDLSHATDEHGRTYGQVSPDKFTHIAPELFTGARTTRSSDIYSFGRVIRDITEFGTVDGPKTTYFEQLDELGVACLASEPQARVTLWYVISRLTRIARELVEDKSIRGAENEACQENA